MLVKYQKNFEQSLSLNFAKLQNRVKESTLKLKNTENQESELKNNLLDIIEINSCNNKKLKNFEEKEFTLATRLKALEAEKKQFQDIKINLEAEIDKSNVKKEEMEINIKELEVKLNELSKQSNEKDHNMTVYIQEMNEMLEIFEKKTTELQNLTNQYSFPSDVKSIQYVNYIPDTNNNYNSNLNDKINDVIIDQGHGQIIENRNSTSSNRKSKSTFKITTFPSNLIFNKNLKSNSGNKKKSSKNYSSNISGNSANNINTNKMVNSLITQSMSINSYHSHQFSSPKDKISILGETRKG